MTPPRWTLLDLEYPHVARALAAVDREAEAIRDDLIATDCGYVDALDGAIAALVEALEDALLPLRRARKASSE